MFDNILVSFADMMRTNIIAAPAIAFAAGILTSFMPCSLSSVPLVIGYVGGVGERNVKRSFVLSLIFALGTAITFTVLGAAAAAAGSLIGTSHKWWYILLGILMVLMALQTWEIFNFIPSSNLLSKNKKRGIAGAFIAGILSGIFSSPCATPVLVALLAVAAETGNLFYGMILMFVYGAGHSIVSIAAGTSVGFVQRIKSSGAYGKAGNVFKIVLGLLILFIGLYMFYLGF